jgi:putative Holliday junction resolvase
MAILGIDHGLKRIGIAISDETKTLARELDIVAPGKFFPALEKLLQEHTVEKVVIGLPLAMSGSDSAQTLLVREFAETLRAKTGLPVDFSDERLSSAMASSLPGGSHEIDSLAAQIILQNYLDKNKNAEQ